MDQRNVDSLALEFSGMGSIYEDEVESYDIYFVDSCNELLDDAFHTVATRDSTDQILCEKLSLSREMLYNHIMYDRYLQYGIFDMFL